jgi:cell division protein FtsL
MVRLLWIMLLAIVVALAPGGVYMLLQSQCLELAYEIGDLRSENERLTEEQRRLTVQRARLESLPKIEAWAHRRKGLAQPAPEKVVVLQPESTQTEGLVAGRIDPQ